MFILLGLVILVVAGVIAVAGVLSNGGSGHAMTGAFAVFGYHVTGSTGTLFLYGVVVGAVAVFGLSVLLGGARRTSRRGRAARSELKESRRETVSVSQDRDNLIDQRDAARAYTSPVVPSDGSARGERQLDPNGGRPHHLFRRRTPPSRTVAGPGPGYQNPSTSSEANTAPVVAAEGPPADR